MRTSVLVCMATGLCAAGVQAGTTTYSFRAAEVNSIPIAGDGVARMVVAPGDLVTVEVFLRDWSPEGQMAAAFRQLSARMSSPRPRAGG